MSEIGYVIRNRRTGQYAYGGNSTLWSHSEVPLMFYSKLSAAKAKLSAIKKRAKWYPANKDYQQFLDDAYIIETERNYYELREVAL